jgi:hypothetical protein
LKRFLSDGQRDESKEYVAMIAAHALSPAKRKGKKGRVEAAKVKSTKRKRNRRVDPQPASLEYEQGCETFFAMEDAPTTDVPTTDAPTTDAPTTEVPTTDAPTDEVPTTDAPTDEVQTTEVQTTEVPTDEVPTDVALTTFDASPAPGTSLEPVASSELVFFGPTNLRDLSKEDKREYFKRLLAENMRQH